ncbi:ABC-2 transporter permease [Virgibacillus sp. NKC19-16]|uniref:ABC-2 transporter permease n=1 Tax=Virgibacillus salidurans TaxID=2831673 RepID=UPI001F160CA4|nr:ABC-2 transporter permease [Virgibacillus sp. NKC19-16]UJL46174.1 ABC-2 transporter permease [Virgibacillus sp. NKC19-16]
MMRTSVVIHLIKEECYSNRHLLFWYFLTSLVLAGVLIYYSSKEGALDWVNAAGISYEDFSMLYLAVLFIPYAISWMKFSNRPERELGTGYYSYVHTLPITLREIVTGKYITNFLLNGIMAGWLCFLWWAFEMNFPYSTAPEGWTALCIVPFLFASGVLAVELGIFFQWGSSYLSLLFLILLIAFSQFEFVSQLAGLTTEIMESYPVMLWGVSILLSLCVWVLCWRWSMSAYSRY